MHRKSILRLCLPFTAGILLLTRCTNHPAVEANTAFASKLPQDVDSICGISVDSFNTWFRSGTATEDGAVTPANSVTFPHNDNCDFYQWAERMFLWIASPDSSGYGNHPGRVLGSPVFYTVVNGQGDTLNLVPHDRDALPTAVSALRKTGSNRLPVYTDHHGHLYEVLFHRTGEKPLLKNGMAVINSAGLDNPGQVVHAFKTATGTEFYFSNGTHVNTSLDQATGDALMAQNGSLVYYITFVNDMYAFYRTGIKDNYLIDTTFPTTAQQRDEIVSFASAIGYKAPADPNALTIELKTSWVIADSLRDDAKRYITMDALVPTFVKQSNTRWIPFQHQKVKLALVGIHIVGSVANHPEMIWATFEHTDNTPDSAYRYENNKQQIVTVPTNTSGSFLFCSVAGAPYNFSHMQVGDDGSLNATPTYTISASNTLRQYPFGVAYGRRPNQQDTTDNDAESNSELIGINNNIFNDIPGNDVRKNYRLIGATWTSGGTAPNGHVYFYPDTVQPGVAIGTSVLANSTMETYFQATYTSCFYCHSGQARLIPDNLSHIFSFLKPLDKVYK